MLTTYHTTTEAATYWNMLKDVSNEVKLRLIALLSQSVADSTARVAVSPTADDTRTFLSKYSGAWSGQDSAEEIISTITDGRKCKNPISLD